MKNSVKRIIGTIIFASIYFFLGAGCSIILFMYFAENLINNFGQSQAFTIYMAFFLFFILFVGSLIFVKFFLREKKWFYLTILIMIFLLVIGYSLINDIVGNQKLNLNLLENGKNIVGEIKCKGVQGPLVEGGVFCETNIDVPLVNKTQTMVVTLEGIGKDERDFSKNYFYAEKSINYIFFNITGYDENGNMRFFNVGWPFKPLSEEAFKRNQERYIAALIALLAVIFITIPSAMISLRNLWRDK